MTEISAPKRIMFSGGGTGGPVTPLFAVAQRLLDSDENWELIFVGSRIGPERELVEKSGLDWKFIALPAGKWRRYFSLRNFLDIFKIIVAFFKALIILMRLKPEIIVSAGGFVSVPLVWAAACRKIPVLIHQQDIRPGLANRLMAPWARVITVTFEKSLADFGPRAVWTGNPIRDLSDYAAGAFSTRKQYNLKLDKPLVMIIGGATGARALNELAVAIMPRLLAKAQVIHLTGRRNSTPAMNLADHYSFEFLPQEEVLRLLAAADIVISRCGLGVLTELSTLKKAAILVPMPGTHQEENAAIFARAGAAIIMEQPDLTAKALEETVAQLLRDAARRESLARAIGRMMKSGAAERIAELIEEICLK